MWTISARSTKTNAFVELGSFDYTDLTIDALARATRGKLAYAAGTSGRSTTFGDTAKERVRSKMADGQTVVWENGRDVPTIVARRRTAKTRQTTLAGRAVTIPEAFVVVRNSYQGTTYKTSGAADRACREAVAVLGEKFEQRPSRRLMDIIGTRQWLDGLRVAETKKRDELSAELQANYFAEMLEFYDLDPTTDFVLRERSEGIEIRRTTSSAGQDYRRSAEGYVKHLQAQGKTDLLVTSEIEPMSYVTFAPLTPANAEKFGVEVAD